MSDSDVPLQQIEATAGALAAVAKLVYSQWGGISEHYQAAQIVSEAAGLFDIVTGNHHTNPEQRARFHLEALDRLVEELPTLANITSHGPDPDDGHSHRL